MKFLYKLLILMLLSAGTVLGAAPTCQLYNGAPYCSYNGYVKGIYVNATDTIILYFDTPLAAGSASSVGFTATNTNAAAIPISENPEFAKLFYSTALAAQASKRKVTIQMRYNHGSYLKMDRIWLYE